MSAELLQEGDVINLLKGHTVYTMLPEHFVYSNKLGTFDELAQATVVIGGGAISMDTLWLCGKYVVVKTLLDGGGVCHGFDFYPDGHHVWCENVKHPHIKVNFYQTGCFTAMIKPEDIQSIKYQFDYANQTQFEKNVMSRIIPFYTFGKAERSWTVK